MQGHRYNRVLSGKLSPRSHNDAAGLHRPPAGPPPAAARAMGVLALLGSSVQSSAKIALLVGLGALLEYRGVLNEDGRHWCAPLAAARAALLPATAAAAGGG